MRQVLSNHRDPQNWAITLTLASDRPVQASRNQMKRQSQDPNFLVICNDLPARAHLKNDMHTSEPYFVVSKQSASSQILAQNSHSVIDKILFIGSGYVAKICWRCLHFPAWELVKLRNQSKFPFFVENLFENKLEIVQTSGRLFFSLSWNCPRCEKFTSLRSRWCLVKYMCRVSPRFGNRKWWV